MERAAVMARTEAQVRAALAGEGTGHDWWHADRVRHLALRLGEEEGADPFVVGLAALLHDLADWKFRGGDEGAAPREAAAWLEGNGVAPEVVAHVAEIVGTLSFKGAAVATPMRTLEGRVVQDADRLDALGAIGVARAFAYGGSRGQPLHDPEIAPARHGSAAAYMAGGGTTLNHFDEKLLLLRDRLNTDAARRLADGRHRFMEEFVTRFLAEWDGRE